MISQHFSNYGNVFETIKLIDYLITQNNRYIVWIDDTNSNINWLLLPEVLTNSYFNDEITTEVINNNKNDNILITDYQVSNLKNTSHCIYHGFDYDEMIIVDFCCQNNTLSVLVGEFDPLVFIIDLDNNSIIASLKLEVFHKILKIYYSKSGNRLIVYTLDNSIYLYDISIIHTPQHREQQLQHQELYYQLEGEIGDGYYNFINISITENIQIQGWIYYYCPLLFYNDTKLVLYNGDLCIYDIDNKKWLYEFKENLGMRKPIKSMTLTPCEKYIFIECFNNIVKQFSTEENKVIASYYIDESLEWKYDLYFTTIDNKKINYLGAINNEMAMSDIMKYKFNIFNLEKIIKSNIIYLDKKTGELTYPLNKDTNTFKNNNLVDVNSITLLQNNKQMIIVSNKENCFYLKNHILVEDEYIILIKDNTIYKFINLDMSYNYYNKQYFPEVINNKISNLYPLNDTNDNNNTNVIDNKEQHIKLNYLIINKLMNKIKLYKVLVK
jgi:hypothetical protein